MKNVEAVPRDTGILPVRAVQQSKRFERFERFPTRWTNDLRWFGWHGHVRMSVPGRANELGTADHGHEYMSVPP